MNKRQIDSLSNNTTQEDGLRWPILVWLCNRLFILVIAWVALATLPVRTDEWLWNAYPPPNPLNGLIRWDSGWYVHIAQYGYIAPSEIQDGQQRNTAFFPLYPLLTRWGGKLIGDFYLSGLFISNISFLIGILLLYKKVQILYGKAVAKRTIIVLLFHPCSFFFSALYTESLFLLCAILFFHFSDRGRLCIAGVWASAATATRIVGIMFIPALIITSWYKKRSFGGFLRIALPAVLVSATGGGAYLVFLALKYGNPLEFAVAQNVEGWAASSTMIPKGPMDLFNLLFVPLVLFLLFLGRKLIKPDQFLWMALTIFMSLARWPSMSRLSLVLFPLYVVAAIRIRHRILFYSGVTASTILLVINTMRFALRYWVA